MKFEVLKDVVIDGHSYKAGKEIDADAERVTRLVNLGFVMPVHEAAKTETRVAKPKIKRAKKEPTEGEE